MENDYVTRTEYSEHSARVDDENKRQNERLSHLESSVKEIERLALSVERMAVSLDNMIEEQKVLSARILEIEKKPAKRWDSVITYIISGVIGLLIGAMSAGLIK